MCKYRGIIGELLPGSTFATKLRFLESSWQRSVEVVFWTLLIFLGVSAKSRGIGSILVEMHF